MPFVAGLLEFSREINFASLPDRGDLAGTEWH